MGLRQIILNFSSLPTWELGVGYLHFADCRDLHKCHEQLTFGKVSCS